MWASRGTAGDGAPTGPAGWPEAGATKAARGMGNRAAHSGAARCRQDAIVGDMRHSIAAAPAPPKPRPRTFGTGFAAPDLPHSRHAAAWPWLLLGPGPRDPVRGRWHWLRP